LDKIYPEILLDDIYHEGFNSHFESSLEASSEDLDKIKTQANILSVCVMFGKSTISKHYKEWDYVKAIHPEYLFSDRDRKLYYLDYNEIQLREILQEFLFDDREVLDNFRIKEFESYLAYLSLLKYYMFDKNELSSYMGNFCNSVYRFG
jgi:hypothetical protein